MTHVNQVTTTNAKGTVIGAFTSEMMAQNAITNLQAAGFDPNNIGVIARNNKSVENVATSTGTKAGEGMASGAVTGGVLGGLAGLLVGLGALVIPGVGPVIAGGALATALGSAGATAAATAATGAAIGVVGGGIVGGLIGLGIPESEARVYNEHFMAGDILVSVTAGARAAEAQNILMQSGAVDLRNQLGGNATTTTTTTNM
jgi:hypothetical protein